MTTPICAICGTRAATHICQSCGRAVCGNCINPATWTCSACSARLSPETAPTSLTYFSPLSVLLFIASAAIFIRHTPRRAWLTLEPRSGHERRGNNLDRANPHSPREWIQFSCHSCDRSDLNDRYPSVLCIRKQEKTLIRRRALRSLGPAAVAVMTFLKGWSAFESGLCAKNLSFASSSRFTM